MKMNLCRDVWDEDRFVSVTLSLTEFQGHNIFFKVDYLRNSKL